MDFELLAKTFRGEIEENSHFGFIVVSDAAGNIVFSLGNPDRTFFPRSSFKLIQALGVLQSGAAKTFGLSDQRLALACASHHAEEFQTEEIQKWLEEIDCSKDDLICGPAYPKHGKTRKKFYTEKIEPQTYHHECSGKHCGLLTASRVLKRDLSGYHLREHPTQREIAKYFLELSELSPQKLQWAIDGCLLPTPAFPANAMAKVLARYSAPNFSSETQKFKQSFERILSCVLSYPEFLSGSENIEAEWIQMLKGRLVLKSGADGVYALILPELQLGAVIKIASGNPNVLPTILAALLKKLKVISDSEFEEMSKRAENQIFDSRQNIVGKIRAIF